MTRQETLEVLRRVPLFADIPEPALSVLVDYFDLMEGSAGDRLYAEGDVATGMYVVAQGSLVGSVRGPDKREHVVREIVAPDSFGELSLLLRSERLVSVDARERVLVLELSIGSFRLLKHQNPDVCLLLIMAIVRRFGRVLDGSRDVIKRVLLRSVDGLDV